MSNTREHEIQQSSCSQDGSEVKFYRGIHGGKRRDMPWVHYASQLFVFSPHTPTAKPHLCFFVFYYKKHPNVERERKGERKTKGFFEKTKSKN